MIFFNHSTCPLCGNVISNQENFISFPPFIPNAKDPLSVFNDNSVHLECLSTNPFKDQILYLKNKYELVQNSIKSEFPRIEDAKNILFFNLLTSIKNEPLYKYNFLYLDQRDIEKWEERETFLKEAKLFLESGKWESISPFNFLKYLIEKIEDN